MARISKGILGGFSGTVGPVVGSSWKGIAVMKSRPVYKRVVIATPDQLNQRGLFGTLSQLVIRLSSVVNIGFRAQANQMTMLNAAFIANYGRAVSGTYPSYTIDYDRLTLAKGGLIGVDNPTATDNGAGGCDVSWQDNTGQSGALADDEVIVAIVNKVKETVIQGVAARRDGSLVVTYPLSWSGDSAYVYYFTKVKDGDKCSNSEYLAQIVCS